MQMIMIIKVVCAIMKLKMLFSKRGLFCFFLICTSLLFKNFQLEFASHEILFILDSMPLSK